MINKIYTLYKRYGVVGIVENIILKSASIFGYKQMQILRLVSKNTETVKDKKSLTIKIISIDKEKFFKYIPKDSDRFSNIYINQLRERFEMDDSEYKCYGIIKNNFIVAYSWTSLKSVPRYKEKLKVEDAFIFDVYTHPDFRGQGLFPALLEYQIDELKNIGKKRALACIDIFNRSSLHAFKKAGFDEISKYLMWKKKGIVHSTLKM